MATVLDAPESERAVQPAKRSVVRIKPRTAFILAQEAFDHLRHLETLSGRSCSSLTREALLRFARQPVEYQRRRLGEELLLLQRDVTMHNEQATISQAACQALEGIAQTFRLRTRRRAVVFQAAILDLKDPRRDEAWE
jgi:hypothetical protein